MSKCGKSKNSQSNDSKTKHKSKQKAEESLSKRDWEELMGKNKPRYYRGPGGAYRTK
ncbi:hypothetical protein ACSVDA_15415 [Cytobacillus sp. Hm23]